MLVAPELMEILRCPKCRGRLSEREASLFCAACRLLYAVTDQIPNCLVDEARPADSR